MSPDGSFASYVSGNDLYVVNIKDSKKISVTRDGSKNILNGKLDWVYQEEIYGRGDYKGHWWSPDSKKLAFLRFDQTQVATFTITNYSNDIPTVYTYHYPRVGQKNPLVSLGIYNVVTNKHTWVDLSKYKEEFLIVKVSWGPRGKFLVYQVQDRAQKWLDLNIVDLETGKSQTLLRESSHAWVEITGDPVWLKDGSFLWLSERSGWKHIYHYNEKGILEKQLTKGKWDVHKIQAFDDKRIYFSASKDSFLEHHAYVLHRKKRKVRRLTKPNFSHWCRFSPNGKLFLDEKGNIDTPTKIHLKDSTGKLLRVISENKIPLLKQYKLGKTQFIQIKARDNFPLEAIMITPPSFNPKKQYPVICSVYGGPRAPKVLNEWNRRHYFWHQMMAQKGYIVWILDNRSASDKGINSAWSVYRSFGTSELRDIEDGVAWLKKQPYVDKKRIGIWGWSFGGYITCYALTHSKSFKIGVAVAPVTDWLFYDTIYTERYMGLLKNNAVGYKKSSPIYKAKDLHGELFIIHGALDDNVHFQNTLRFVYELQKYGKQFSMMVYPASKHGIRNKYSNFHLFKAITKFIDDKL